MGSSNVFTTDDVMGEWAAQGHNRRTVHAFHHGVKAAAIGGDLIYGDGSSDYAEAESCGFQIARRMIRSGRMWRCCDCGAVHAEAEQEQHALTGLRLVMGEDGAARLRAEYATGYVTEVCRVSEPNADHWVSWAVVDDYQRLATEALVREGAEQEQEGQDA